MKNVKHEKMFRLAVTGILAAAALAVSFAERFLFAALPLPMGIKPGFSNIIVMFACCSVGIFTALGIAAAKAAFAAILSGAAAGFISLAGGILSVITMYAAVKLSKGKLSYTGISVLSSVMHNAGQLIAASVIAGSPLFIPYSPVLVVSGVIFGIVTGVILTYTMPYLEKAVKK